MLIHLNTGEKVPSFFGELLQEEFFLPKQCKNLDTFYKADLDFWDCFRSGKPYHRAEFHMTDFRAPDKMENLMIIFLISH